jgi:hypothetical protein
VLLVAVALRPPESATAPMAPAGPEAPAGEAASGVIRVVDGDTLDVGGERIRIVNIDTPEMPPKAKCASEADGALRARDRLDRLVRAGPVTLERTGTDRYGRTLAHVRVDGEDAGESSSPPVSPALGRPPPELVRLADARGEPPALRVRVVADAPAFGAAAQPAVVARLHEGASPAGVACMRTVKSLLTSPSRC